MNPSLVEAIKEDPAVVIRTLLESDFWIGSLDAMESYMRFEDDSRKGSIRVTFSPDGDGWIMIMSERDPNDLNWSSRFRTDFSGGGESPRVRVALLIMAEAIRLDNEKHPQHR